MHRAAFYLACASAAVAPVSIAACQILLGAALAAMLISRERFEFPRPIVIPLGIFVLLTLVSLVLSDNIRSGLPQLKKFYVYLMLPVVFTFVRRIDHIRNLIWCWAAAASASGIWSFVQFWMKRQKALAQHADFYLSYVGDRATGFVGHWMTFGAAQMSALILLFALLIFAPPRRHRWWGIAAVTVISASITIGWTRSVWLAAAVGIAYLVAIWRPKYLALAPLLLIVGWFISPRSVRERAISIYQPHGQVDSNQHRYITSRTGIAMIKAHPWFGIGPDMPGKAFYEYLPGDIRRPLPEGFYGHLHNVYLQFGAERGIPALLAFLALVGITLGEWWRSARAALSPSTKAILHGSIACLLAILIGAFFEHNLGDSEILSMFWIVVAWGYRAREAAA